MVESAAGWDSDGGARVACSVREPSMSRRRMVLAMGALACLGGCAGFAYAERVRVSLVGLDPIEGQGLELRFMAKIRLQNPNDAAIEFDGAALELELGGADFATGVSDRKGAVPRFGEAVLEVPVTVPALAIVRQVFGIASGTQRRTDYRVRGFLSVTGLGRLRFEATGDVGVPGSTPR